MMQGTEIRDVLVLMACSATKRDEPCQPIQMYQGPMWRTLRTHIGRVSLRDVFVLSGKYGFRQCQEHQQPYNAMMTRKFADELIRNGFSVSPAEGYQSVAGRIEFARRSARAYDNVIIAAAGLYAEVYEAWLPMMVGRGFVSPEADVRRVSGGIGEQRGQLGEWLRELNARKPLMMAI